MPCGSRPQHVSDKIRQPDRWHAARHSPCEGECGFGLDGFDRWYPQALCANARVAAPGLQPVCCFAKFLIERFDLLGEIDSDIDRNGNGNAGLSLCSTG